MATSEERRTPPPYVAFKTLLGFIERLSKTTVPSVIDPSVMNHMSGQTRSEVRGAMKFLGLVDASGTVHERLQVLVKAFGTDSWKQELSNRISEAYTPILGDLNLQSATQGQLAAAFKERGGVDQQVREKAIRFFIAALGESGSPYSPHLKARGASTIGRTVAPRPKSRAVRMPHASPKYAALRRSLVDDDSRDRIAIPDGFIVHQFQLRRDVFMPIAVPPDFTAKDAARVARYLSTLPIDEEGSDDEAM